MKRFLMAALLSSGAVAYLAAGPALAQFRYGQPSTNPYASPTVSPYLNLLRPGGTPALNYYNLVRPQVEYNAAISNLQYQVQANSQNIAGVGEQTQAVLTTGHPAYFMTYRKYFMNLGGGAAGSFSTTGGLRPNTTLSSSSQNLTGQRLTGMGTMSPNIRPAIR